MGIKFLSMSCISADEVKGQKLGSQDPRQVMENKKY